MASPGGQTDAAPALVNNAETLANIPGILAQGAGWFREVGTPESPGTIICTVSGGGRRAGVAEFEMGTPLAEVIETEEGPRTRITIFLNVFNVHVNRVPVGGTVELVEYKEGKFLNAMRPDSAVHNEQTMIAINTGDYVVVFKQIAGLLARRIVCNLNAGDRVVRGQRMGLIKFGSRTDVLLPTSATIRVKPGDHVKGGSSILAAMPAGSLSGLEPVDGSIG